MFDLNETVNREIEKARMQEMYDLATELLKISSEGSCVSEWVASRERMIDRCHEVQTLCAGKLGCL